MLQLKFLCTNNDIEVKVDLSTNDAYGISNTTCSIKTNEETTVYCTIPPVENQHLYEHVNDSVATKEIMV